MAEYVVLVDANDTALGAAEKMAAHAAPGKLHRAISVFLFDVDGRVLLQQRANSKHHFRSLWSNTACSHPRPGESVTAAGERRLQEEMGCSASLSASGFFTYRAVDVDSGLVEHELDHVLIGQFDGTPTLNPEEARAFEWIDPAGLATDIAARPDRYTPWFAQALEFALS